MTQLPKPKPYNTQSSGNNQRPYRPRSDRQEEELSPEPCQHVRILDCNKPISRVIYECYRCKQGLLTEVKGANPVQEIDVVCPNCGRTAIKLTANEVISTTAILSPWQ